MSRKMDFLRCRWKPPFIRCRNHIANIALLLMLILQIAGSIAIDPIDRDDGNLDNLNVIVEPEPYSLKFSLNETDEYTLTAVVCSNGKKATDQQINEHTISSRQEEFKCEGLEPCTNYKATLSLETKDGEHIEKIMDAATSYTAPTSTITEIEPFVDQIILRWIATDASCISEYEVKVQSIDKQFKWNINDNKQTEQVISDLKPCQDHNIQFITYDVNKVIVSNSTANSTTEYAEPGNIIVEVQPTANAQVKISWKPPEYYTCIDYYYLKWFIDDCQVDSGSTESPTEKPPDSDEVICEWSAQIMDPNAKEYIITDLQGCENYTFEAFINSETNSKCEQTQFTAPEKVPGQVTLETANITATSITLYWNEPQLNRKCVSGYHVTVSGPLQRSDEEIVQMQADINATSVFFADLDPCGNYNYTIVAISHNTSAGQAVKSEFSALDAQPSVVQNAFVIQEPYALNISWEAPEFADLCLNGYRLSGWNDNNSPVNAFDRTTNSTHVRIEGLYSCQSYTVQIIATTENKDGDPLSIETETSAIISQQPKFQVITVYSNGLELSAQDSDLTNKCETIFAHFACKTNFDVPYKSAERYVEGVVGDISFRALLSPLSPHTKYECYARFFNVAGWSPQTQIVANTGPYFPDPPENVSTKALTNISVTFYWQEPKHSNGNINLYINHFQFVKVNYFQPPSCSKVIYEPIIRETSSLEQNFGSLQPYSMYSIQVAARNEYGVGEYTLPYMVVTLPWIPNEVTNLRVQTIGPFISETEYMAMVMVTWRTPCKSNGKISKFRLEFTGERVEYEKLTFERYADPIFDIEGDVMFNETDLKPEYHYIVSVSVLTESKYTSETSKQQFIAPAGIPKKFDDSSVKKIVVDPFEADNPTYSAVVRFPADILESDSGSIAYMALLVSEKDCYPDPDLVFGAMNSHSNWPDTPSWNQVYTDDSCIQQYQTTPIRWTPNMNSPNLRLNLNDRNKDEIIYIIGTEDCSNTGYNDYCNGPLKADTEYNLVLRLFTKSGYNDAAMLQFKTDSLIRLNIILGCICGSLLLALIAGFVYYWMSKRMADKRASINGIEDSFGNIHARNFALCYTQIARPEKVSREFQELSMVAMDLSTSASELGFNKNRYTDIFPYDKNRVILDIDADGSDYINASFIDGYRRKKEYIATQGPKPESTMDFWRMCLQHNVRVIVQVTQFREGDVVKCHEYFPFKSRGISVIVKKTETLELYDRTEMTLTHEQYNMKQKIVHFYFKKWPDHGCPYDPQQLIVFVRKVKAERIPSFSPIVVHCSAGVGRTGTFIGLDIIMQRLKTEKKINVYETVKKLRFQRMKMVQTLTQYRFLYKCAYELVKNKVNKYTTKKKKLSSQNSMGSDKKSVTFQDDELSQGITVLGSTGSGIKLQGPKPRRNNSDLTCVNEEEMEDDAIINTSIIDEKSNSNEAITMRSLGNFRTEDSQRKETKSNGVDKKNSLN